MDIRTSSWEAPLKKLRRPTDHDDFACIILLVLFAAGGTPSIGRRPPSATAAQRLRAVQPLCCTMRPSRGTAPEVHDKHVNTADKILTIDPIGALECPAGVLERFKVRPTSLATPFSQRASPARVRPMLLRHWVREASLLMKGEWRFTPRDGVHKAALAG